MGLPVPCGTTTHGTAFDKAGQGVANPGSLRAALRYAVALAEAAHT
jgi:4-hydroxythreonine-4-phosphate dehydrogenase